jgi:hypothetical protein
VMLSLTGVFSLHQVLLCLSKPILCAIRHTVYPREWSSIIRAPPVHTPSRPRALSPTRPPQSNTRVASTRTVRALDRICVTLDAISP